jgi:hypothetical protein
MVLYTLTCEVPYISGPGESIVAMPHVDRFDRDPFICIDDEHFLLSWRVQVGLNYAMFIIELSAINQTLNDDK